MDLTIILQGISNSEIDVINTITEYITVGKVILSIYRKREPKDLLDKIESEFPDVLIVDNDEDAILREFKRIYGDIDDRYYQNTFFQINTTSAGLSHVTTKYCIKTRIDHYYSNFGNFAKCMHETNKIVSSSLFVRGYNFMRYHVSDQLFGGLTTEIKDVFSSCYKSKDISLWSEVFIWKPWILKKCYQLGLETEGLHNYCTSMSELFVIYPVCKYDYKVKLSNIVKIKSRRSKLGFGIAYDFIFIHTDIESKEQTTYNYFKNGVITKY